MDLQELLSLAIVAAAAALLLARLLRRRPRRTPGCGGSCDCPASLQLPEQSDILH